MKNRNATFLATFVAIVLTASAAAQTITGTVVNGTTGKPAANADVVLIALGGGNMHEAARTKSGPDGRFSLNAKPAEAPHLIRVEHAGVNYHKMAPPGATTADVTIYDVASKPENISLSIENAYEAHDGEIHAVQFVTARNATSPPRTIAGDSTLELVLPEGAKVQATQAQAPGGQPVTAPAEEKGGGRVAFRYPLRPGDTIFQIGYTLPYKGELTLTPRAVFPIEQFALILPPTMKFEPATAGLFQPEQHASGVNIQIAAAPGARDLTYRIAGEGALPQASEIAQAGEEGVAGRGPGGGLGAPINSPDPLFAVRWPLLGGLSAMLALGGLFLVARRPAGQAASGVVAENAPATGAPSPLLAGLRDELFRLEVDRQGGRISQAEYEEAKAALDKTLQRALGRN